jgi:hypothetical protein
VTAFGAATALAVLTPRYPLQHYLIPLLAPVSLSAGRILGVWAGDDPAAGSRRYAGTLFAVCMLGLPLTGVVPALRGVRATRALRATLDHSPARVIARAIRAGSPGAKSMAV